MTVLIKNKNVVVKNVLQKILFAIVTAFMFLSSSGCVNFGDRNCNEDIITQKTSPKGDYVAVFMQRNCHITSPSVIHINIRSSKKDFIRDSSTHEIKQGQVFRISDGFDVTFEWLSNRKLKISCPNCLKANYIGKIEKWDVVEIVYEFSSNEINKPE